MVEKYWKAWTTQLGWKICSNFYGVLSSWSSSYHRRRKYGTQCTGRLNLAIFIFKLRSNERWKWTVEMHDRGYPLSDFISFIFDPIFKNLFQKWSYFWISLANPIQNSHSKMIQIKDSHAWKNLCPFAWILQKETVEKKTFTIFIKPRDSYFSTFLLTL